MKLLKVNFLPDQGIYKRLHLNFQLMKFQLYNSLQWPFLKVLFEWYHNNIKLIPLRQNIQLFEDSKAGLKESKFIRNVLNKQRLELIHKYLVAHSQIHKHNVFHNLWSPKKKLSKKYYLYLKIITLVEKAWKTLFPASHLKTKNAIKICKIIPPITGLHLI